MRELRHGLRLPGFPGAGGYFKQWTGTGALSEVADGIIMAAWQLAKSLPMGGNTLAMIRAMQQQGALTRVGRAESDRDERTGSKFPRRW
jgi:hypothetical protein